MINNSNHLTEAPISIFNNITSKISQEFEQIFYFDDINYKFNKNKSLLSSSGNIMFNDNTIILFNFIKLHFHRNELMIKILKPNLNQNDLKIICHLQNDWNKVNMLFNHYILMYNNIAHGIDDVPNQLINNIIDSFINDKINDNDFFIIPYKKKISHLYDNDKAYLENIFNRYGYILKLHKKRNSNFEYRIYRVVSNKLNQDKNELKNIRFEESDLISNEILPISMLTTFINKLYFYGELIKNPINTNTINN